MKFASGIAVVLLLALAAAGLAQRMGGLAQPRGGGQAQRVGGNRWAEYEFEMQDAVNDPPDAARKGEWAFGRLRYRSQLDRGGFSRYARWGIDANKGDRSFITALTRLTRLDTAPIETIIDIDSDEIFNWPWIFAVSAGDWSLSPSQADRLRKYFDRGGYLMVDDFHNPREWASFMYGIHQIDPSAQAIDLQDSDAIFHVIFDMTDRIRVPGANVVYRQDQAERGGISPAWRAIFDDKRRVRVAISFNQDVGDAWEFADDPEYPEKYTTEGIRLGVNYVIYAMTH